MWAITSYYNPARYKRRISNYRIFRANLGAPLVTVELSFDGHFELTADDADILLQISGGAVLWQKERLLNIAMKQVPPNVSSIAWIDCDIVFERPDWADEAQRQLSEVNIVQLFSDLVDFNSEDYQPGIDYSGVISSGHSIISTINKNAHTQINAGLSSRESAGLFAYGAAWAARRGIIEDHGLYDASIVGGGDQGMVDALYGQFEKTVQVQHLNKARQEHYLKWAHPYHRAMGEKIGNVAGRLYHLWHGKFANRNYLDRHRLLANFDFDPDADLVVGSNGAWQWARSRPELERFLANYFISRAEDD